MPVITIVGDFGAGKTTFVKDYVERLPSDMEGFLFALVKNDYDIPIERDFKEYIKVAVNKKDSLFIVDEAKVALPKKLHEPPTEHELRLLTWYINARKLNNFIFQVFHSLAEVPIWCIHYSDMFIRFRTNDQLQYQRTRFSSFQSIVDSLDKYATFENFTCQEIVLRK